MHVIYKENTQSGNHMFVIGALLNNHDNQTNWKFATLHRKFTVNGQKGSLLSGEIPAHLAHTESKMLLIGLNTTSQHTHLWLLQLT